MSAGIRCWLGEGAATGPSCIASTSCCRARAKRCSSISTAGCKKIEAVECRPQRGFTIDVRSIFLLFAIKSSHAMSEPIDALFTTPTMASLFSAEAHVRQLLVFEAALARAEARAGVIPQAAANAIATACQVELFNVAALYREGAAAGTLAIPLVRALTERVAEDGHAFVHWGATSQDAIDTAMMLQMRAGLDILVASLLDLCASCAALAQQHRSTLMAGRT